MSAEVIRDVLIRVSLETGKNMLDQASMSTAAQAAKQVEQSYRNIDQISRNSSTAHSSHSGDSRFGFGPNANPFARGLHHALVTGSPHAGFHFGLNTAINQQIQSLHGHRDEVDANKDAVKQFRELEDSLRRFGQTYADLGPKQKQFFDELQAMSGVASTSLAKIGIDVAKIGPSFGLIGVGASAAAIGIAAAASAMREFAEAEKFSAEMHAKNAEFFGSQKIHLIAMRAGHQRELINAQKDRTHYTTMQGREAERLKREEDIQAAQAQIAHRPLAERQELRDIIEARGRAGEQREEIQGHVDYWEKRKKRYEDAIAKIKKDHPNIEAAHQQAELSREAIKNTRQSTWAGWLFEGAASIPNVVGMNTWHNAADWMAERVGAVTPHMAEDEELQNKKAGIGGQQPMTQKEIEAQQRLLELQRDSADATQHLNDLKEQGLSVTREELAALRQRAESGAEGVRNNMRSFGMMSPGEQARLRRIADKADRGEQLSHRERQLLASSPFDQAKIANQQAEAIAKDPRNAKYFAEGNRIQKEKEAEYEKAKKDFKPEQNKTVDEIGKLTASLENADKAVVSELAKLNNAIQVAFEHFGTELQNITNDIEIFKLKATMTWER